ncbi:MAG: hypothetical protein AB7N70_18915, partial [Dehalococcoidia bacterium]
LRDDRSGMGGIPRVLLEQSEQAFRVLGRVNFSDRRHGSPTVSGIGVRYQVFGVRETMRLTPNT